jgi:type VI protein secretion system component Hcp
MGNLFLTIDGMDGGSFNEKHAHSFEIQNFKFELAQIAPAHSSGLGSGAGKVVFQPLTIDFVPQQLMTALLKVAASGKVIKHLMLQEDTNDPHGGGFAVYDLRLDDVIVTHVVDSNGADHAEFSFRKMSLKETPQNPDGSKGTPTIFSFDTTKMLAGSTELGVATAAIGKPVIGGLAEVSNYFVHVDGVKGDSVDVAHKGDFNVSGFDFDVQSVLKAAASGVGTQVSKSTFSPLTVELDAHAPTAGLVKLVAMGRHVKTVELKGVDLDGHQVYDLRLSDVFMSHLSKNTGGEEVSFDYSKISLTTHTLNTDGTLDQGSTFSWNLKTNAVALDHGASARSLHHVEADAVLPGYASFHHDWVI